MLDIPIHIVLLSKHLSVVEKSSAAENVAARGGRGGGKPATDWLLKTVKPHGKRADFLRYFLAFSNGRSVEDCMAHFNMKRPNVFAYWTAINRDHGIGYALRDGVITPILPPKQNPKSIFGVK